MGNKFGCARAKWTAVCGIEVLETRRLLTVAAPTNLLGTTPDRPLELNNYADLSWTDNSNNEDGFEVERSDGGGSFAPVSSDHLTVGQNVTQYLGRATDLRVDHAFRVRAMRTVGGVSE